jgi:trigger factor
VKVTTERLPKSIIALDIELDQQQVQKGLDRAARKLSQQYRIPGFRPGKAPRQIVENYFGRERLLDEAAEDLIQKTFPEALKQEHIVPVGRPSLESVEQNPFRYRVAVPVEPTIELPDYTSYAIPYELEPITDEQVERLLEAQREQHVVLKELDEPRPAQPGDMLTVRIIAEEEEDEEDEDGADETDALEADLEADVDEEAASEDDETVDEEDEEETQQIALVEGRVHPDVYAALIGAQPGETRTFIVHYGDDEADEALRGRDVTYTVTVENIQERLLPDWDELPTLTEFEGDLDALRANGRQRLEQAAQTRARQDVINAFLERIEGETTIDIPDAMIQDRAEELFEAQIERIKRLGITEEQFLEATGKTREEAIAEQTQKAEVDLRRFLTVREFIRREGLALTDEEIAAETEHFLEEFAPERRDEVRQLLTQSNLQQTIRSSALNRKVSDHMFTLATGQTEMPEDEGARDVAQADETSAPQVSDAAEHGPQVLSDIATDGVSDAESIFEDPGPQEVPGGSSVEQTTVGDYGQGTSATAQPDATSEAH